MLLLLALDRHDRSVRSAICAMRTESWLRLRWLIPVRLSLRPARRIITACFGSDQRKVQKRQDPEKTKSLVLGSGPIRIGQGIEFDYLFGSQCLWSLATERL